MRRFGLVLGLVLAGCGSSGGASIADAPGDGAAIDAPPSCALLPSGALTRYAGNPLLRNGPEMYDDLKTGPRVVLVMGPSDYRIWYEAVSSDGITAVGYATSTDGLTWTKRGLVMSPGLSWEKSEVSPNSILVENGTFVMYYHGGGYPGPGGVRLGNGLIGRATSSDGITWTKIATPVLTIGSSGAFDDDQVAEPRVIALAGGYRMYFTGRNAASGTTALGVADSTDGITWTKDSRNPIMATSQWGNFWGGAFFHEGDQWHLWHGVSSGSTSSLHYMLSPDGIAWTEGPTGIVLAQSTDSGAADYGLVGDSVSGYRDGATYRIMYTGFNSNLFGSEGRFEGICMASIASPCP